jgi:hypothetical protein
MHEAIHDIYRGVTCFRCMEPIPVSAKLAGPWGESNNQESNPTYSFPLRCGVCEEEGIYLVSDVHDFEGKPTPRRFNKRRNHAHLRAMIL